MTLSLSQEKIQQIISHCQKILEARTVTQTIIHNTCSLTSSGLLPEPTRRQNLIPPPREQLQSSRDTFERVFSGTKYMDYMSSGLKRSGNSTPVTRFDNTNRRTYEWMGCMHRSIRDRWPLDTTGTVSSHQLPRTVGSMAYHQSLPQRKERHFSSSSDGQFCGHLLHQSSRRNTLNTDVSVSCQDLGMVSRKKPFTSSTTYPRVSEHHSRQDVSNFQRQGRMATSSGSIPNNYGGHEFCSCSRPFCVPPEHSTTNLCLMATRSNGLESQRCLAELEEHKGLCFPPVYTSAKMSSENQQGGLP